MYTLDNITTAPSYDALKRNGFTDLDAVAYYGIPKGDTKRGTMFIQIKAEYLRKKFNAPKPNVGTQKCTSIVDIDSVRQMALEYMDKTWTYNGRSFNLNDLGWSFSFNDRKRANGMCYSSRKKIYLSQWVVENSDREMKGWINTMIHEIAHAVNGMLGGRGHDAQWRRIFMSWGGSGERCSSDVGFSDLIANPVSKYTLICPNGHQSVGHKRSRRVESGNMACGKCCKEHNNGKYSTKYRLKQIQNY